MLGQCCAWCDIAVGSTAEPTSWSCPDPAVSTIADPDPEPVSTATAVLDPRSVAAEPVVVTGGGSWGLSFLHAGNTKQVTTRKVLTARISYPPTSCYVGLRPRAWCSRLKVGSRSPTTCACLPGRARTTP